MKAAQAFAKEGYTHVVDMDITKFFDRVNHDILMQKAGSVVRDKRVLRIIGRFLRAGVVMPDGDAVSSEEGTPQGGPLSPLLANIHLDALDKELEKRGLRFSGYADDCNIYVKSQAAAERVPESLTGWIARHLRLEVSASKSGTGRPWERKFDSGAHRAFTPSGLPVGSLCRSAPFLGSSSPPPCSSPSRPPALPGFRTRSGSSGTPGNRSRPWSCVISGAAM